MMRRTLAGLQKAAAVVCVSQATRCALRASDLVPEARLHLVYPGTHPECSPDPDPTADAEAARLLGPPYPLGPPDLLHVGSTIPRKRLDVVLATFAAVRRVHPGARLIKVGGVLTDAQERHVHDLGIGDALVTLLFCPRSILAALYRRAALVLQPSEAEGFGLPAVEAIACAAPLLASDLPALREAGGIAAVYCPVGDVPAWSQAALTLLDDYRHQADAWHARRHAGLAHARRFQWSNHVRQLTAIYQDVLSRLGS